MPGPQARRAAILAVRIMTAMPHTPPVLPQHATSQLPLRCDRPDHVPPAPLCVTNSRHARAGETRSHGRAPFASRCVRIVTVVSAGKVTAGATVSGPWRHSSATAPLIPMPARSSLRTRGSRPPYTVSRRRMPAHAWGRLPAGAGTHAFSWILPPVRASRTSSVRGARQILSGTRHARLHVGGCSVDTPAVLPWIRSSAGCKHLMRRRWSRRWEATPVAVAAVRCAGGRL